jgi:hypothetical protein
MPTLSPLRARLASFEHAYVVALRLRCATGQHQFVIRTANPVQPVRVSHRAPDDTECLLALVF